MHAYSGNFWFCTEPQGSVVTKCPTGATWSVLNWHHFVSFNVNEHRTNSSCFNTLGPRQNGRHFPDDIFKWIFLNENVWIWINISLKFVAVARGPINNIPPLVQIMAWRRPGDKPLSEPMMVTLLMHICISRPQWVNRDVKLNIPLYYMDW